MKDLIKWETYTVILEKQLTVIGMYNQDKLDKLLAGQSSTQYISPKTHPSEENKYVKFDEYKLLENQFDRWG